MNRTRTLLGTMMLAVTAASSQMASHAPTGLKQAPAQAQGLVTLQAQGKPVARVNNTVLTDVDLLREEYAIFPYARQHNGLPKELAPQIRDGAMKMIVFEELVFQEAQRRRLAIPAARMQKAEGDFRKQFNSPAEFNGFVKSDFQGSQDLLRLKIRRSLLIEALLNVEVESKCTPSLAEVRAYYERNVARFQHPETYTFQTISVLPPANATAAQLSEGRTRIETAYKKAREAKTSEKFGMLAEKLSDDDYRVVMGQHKPVPVDQLAPPVLAALRVMKPGAISGIIPLDQAYTIVHYQQHTPAGKTPFLQVRAQLQKELHESKRNQLRIALDKKLRQNAHVEEM
jgi:peptidyl-prolyl cis-trans isomerase SurA